MGKRGPITEPTVSKRARGNPGKRPLNDKEPKPKKLQNLKAPNWLCKKGKKIWKEISGNLRDNGLLTCVDRDGLARYCDLWVQWFEAREVIIKEGFTVTAYGEDSSGKKFVRSVRKRPEAGVYNDIVSQLLRLEREFGLTPSARSSIKVSLNVPVTPGEAAPADDFDAFVSSRKEDIQFPAIDETSKYDA